MVLSLVASPESALSYGHGPPLGTSLVNDSGNISQVQSSVYLFDSLAGP